MLVFTFSFSRYPGYLLVKLIGSLDGETMISGESSLGVDIRRKLEVDW